MAEIQDPFADQWDAATNGIEISPYRGPSTGENNVPATASITHNWTTPENVDTVVSADAVLSTSGGTPYVLPYLRASNFGFAIPATATVIGIEAEVVWGTGSSPSDYTLAELKLAWGASAASLSTNNQAVGETLNVVALDLSQYGGDADMWGETAVTLTPTVINSTDFGFVLKAARAAGSTTAVLDVDAMRLRVFYSALSDGAVRVTQVEALVLANETKPVRITQVYSEVIMSVNEATVISAGRQQTVIVAG